MISSIDLAVVFATNPRLDLRLPLSPGAGALCGCSLPIALLSPLLSFLSPAFAEFCFPEAAFAWPALCRARGEEYSAEFNEQGSAFLAVIRKTFLPFPSVGRRRRLGVLCF